MRNSEAPSSFRGAEYCKLDFSKIVGDSTIAPRGRRRVWLRRSKVRDERSKRIAMKTPLLAYLCLLGTALPGALAQQEPAPSASPTASAVWIPGKPWALEWASGGFTTRDNEIQPDGSRYFLAENEQSRIMISISLTVSPPAEQPQTAGQPPVPTTEQSPAPTQPDDCKKSLEEKAKNDAQLASAKLRDLAYRDEGDLHILEFRLPQIDGIPKSQKNVFACQRKDNVFVNIHISKLFYREADQPRFEALLQSFRFVPRESGDAVVPPGNVEILFRQGSQFFTALQYRQAIGPYRQALEIEKVASVLDKQQWRTLVANLGASYTHTGDLNRAKETLQYGVDKDPGHPIFYYHLACVAAERDNPSEAVKYLHLAFERRNNLSPAESFPDARVEDSFQKFLRQAEFRKLLDANYLPAQ